jgi:hypothetical protein
VTESHVVQHGPGPAGHEARAPVVENDPGVLADATLRQVPGQNLHGGNPVWQSVAAHRHRIPGQETGSGHVALCLEGLGRHPDFEHDQVSAVFQLPGQRLGADQEMSASCLQIVGARDLGPVQAPVGKRRGLEAMGRNGVAPLLGYGPGAFRIRGVQAPSRSSAARAGNRRRNLRCQNGRTGRGSASRRGEVVIIRASRLPEKGRSRSSGGAATGAGETRQPLRRPEGSG